MKPSNKESENVFNSLDLKSKVDIIKHFKSGYLIRQINKFLVCITANEEMFLVINEETFYFKFFDTEDEATNYCLDNYEKSKQYQQSKLFA